MSESSTIIDPYRSASAQGDIISAIQEMMLRREQLGQLRRADIDRGATNMAINEQQGWQGVDPQQMQQFNRGELDMRNINQQMGINQAVEGRTAQDWQQRQQFGQDMVEGARPRLSGNSDPLLASLAQARANPFIAQLIASQMAAQGQGQMDFNNRMALQGDQQTFQSQQFDAAQAAEAARQALGFTHDQSQANLANQAAMERVRLAAQLQQQQDDAQRQHQMRIIDRPSTLVEEWEQGKRSGASMAAGVGNNYVGVLDARQQDAALAHQASQVELAKNLNKDGASVSTTALAQSKGEAKKQEQQIKDQKYNQKHQLYDFLPDNQKAVLQQNPNLLETIKQSIEQARIGQGDLPPPSYYKKLVPNIYRMVEDANRESAPWGFAK